MNGKYRIIDESNYNVLGTFDSIEAAVEYVATLLSVNDDDYLDDLTIGNEKEGPVLYGDSLRTALKNRANPREHVGASYGVGDSGYGVEAIAAKGRD